MLPNPPLIYYDYLIVYIAPAIAAKVRLNQLFDLVDLEIEITGSRIESSSPEWGRAAL